MPFTASTASFGSPPRDPFDINDRYVVRVAKITEKELPKYEKPDETEMKAIWTFEVFKLDGSPVISAENGIFTVEEFTRLNVAPSKPGKPTAKARTFMEAALGRDPKTAVDGGEDILNTVIGRYAYALFDQKPRTDGGTRLVILKLGNIADQEKVSAAVTSKIGSMSLAAAGAAPEGLPF